MSLRMPEWARGGRRHSQPKGLNVEKTFARLGAVFTEHDAEAFDRWRREHTEAAEKTSGTAHLILAERLLDQARDALPWDDDGAETEAPVKDLALVAIGYALLSIARGLGRE